MITLRLPFPPSVNTAYPNRSGKGRNRYRSKEYEAWLKECGWIISIQKFQCFEENPVEISIDLDDSRQGDADSRLKVILDLLVKNKIIRDDRKRHIRRVSIGWAKVNGCVVRIEKCGNAG